MIIATRLADGDVYVGAEIALLHVAIACAERNEDGAQLLHIGGCFRRRADIRARDDFHQGDARAVQIHISGGGVEVVDRLAGVLFEVETLDADGEGVAVFRFNIDLAFADDGRFELRNLIALRQVGIEIVLPVATRDEIYLGIESEAGLHRLLHAEGVDHRKHARHGGVHQRNIGVRVIAEGGGGA